MQFGAHLPVNAFDGESFTLSHLVDYTQVAAELGYSHLAVCDHLTSPRPWFDSPTAMAAVVENVGEMVLTTAIALPVLRGPLLLAKQLVALDHLTEGRLLVGVAAGSSAADYRAMGIDMESRWKRFDEAVVAMRSLWHPAGDGHRGAFYDFGEVELSPGPFTPGGPDLWIGSWGSEAGLRRAARLGDGWLASAYNTTPKDFDQARRRLATLHDGPPLPNGLSTMFLYVTEDPAEARRVLADVLAPVQGRSPEDLAGRVLVGPAGLCAERLWAYADAGVERVFVWPVEDHVRQIETFVEGVVPQVGKDREMPPRR